MAILSTDERIGTTLAEKYRLDEVLGRGGWGVVFGGTHLWTDRKVAIKLLHPEHARKAHTVKRFLKEAKAAAKLKHPNVVDVLDMGNAEDCVYLVLERLSGRTLRQLLDERERLSTAETLEIVLPVLDALAEAHDRAIIHRDLKPENIFLAEERDRIVPKLLDFGIAKMLDSDTAPATLTGTVVGSPSYMPPEQVQGAPNITRAADVWSIGIVLFECLTGELPFDGANVPSILVQILTKPAPTVRSMRPEIEEPISDTIARALSRAPDERYEDARALRDALRVAAGMAAPIAARPPRPSRRSAETLTDDAKSIGFDTTLQHTPPSLPPSRRSIILPAAAGLALLLGLVIVAAIGMSSSTASPERRPRTARERPIEEEPAREPAPPPALPAGEEPPPIEEPPVAAAEPAAPPRPRPRPRAAPPEVEAAPVPIERGTNSAVIVE